MSWESVNVNDIQLVDANEPIPAGRYTLQLAGAFENKRNATDTDLLFKVADQGVYQGKSLYLDLPDPDRLAWATQTFARVVKALGVTAPPYVNPRTFLNEVAQNGHSRLSADVYIRTWTKQDGTEGSANKIATRSIGPAA